MDISSPISNKYIYIIFTHYEIVLITAFGAFLCDPSNPSTPETGLL